jgi:hypothetical protein
LEKEFLKMASLKIGALLLIIFLFEQPLFTQINFSGYVYSSSTSKPLSYANIQVKGTTIGTITNTNGYFSINLADRYIDSAILISCLGYESKNIPIHSITSQLVVKLNEITTQLDEITIGTSKTILSELENAFAMIKLNYPLNHILLTGFYRESLQEKNGEFLYLGEAVVNNYIPPYDNTKRGRVEILKSRKNTSPRNDSLNSKKFFGSIYITHSTDVVHRKTGPINPKNFKKYTYEYLGLRKYNGKDVYGYFFKAKDKIPSKEISGYIYIDKESLAYCYYTYCISGDWKNETGLRLKDFKSEVYYYDYNGNWYLKACKNNSIYIDDNTQQELSIKGEYVTTDAQLGYLRHIKAKSNIAFKEVFLDRAVTFDESFWNDYTILEQDSITINQLRLQFNNQQSKKFLNNSTKKNVE